MSYSLLQKKGKRKGLGGMTPEKKKLLKVGFDFSYIRLCIYRIHTIHFNQKDGHVYFPCHTYFWENDNHSIISEAVKFPKKNEILTVTDRL